ncbi:MAG: tetratricopeptide repeat protein, partial [Bacteroidetes bacterium]|nr:tetratricopeptide repeat protein [Bacteroidota bacterium]
MRYPLLLLSLLLCLFVAEPTLAQRPAGYSTQNKKAIKAYQASENYLVRRQWERVIELLEEAVGRDANFLEARIRLATAYRALGNMSKAVIHLEAAANPKKGTPAPESLFALGELYWQLGRYQEAQ